MIEKIKKVIAALRQTDGTIDRKFVFAPIIRVQADVLEQIIKEEITPSIEFYLVSPAGHKRIVFSDCYEFHSVQFTKDNRLQLHITEVKKKVEEKDKASKSGREIDLHA